jgi:hypothetical protein
MNPTLGALLALFFCLLPPSSPLMHPLWRVSGLPGPPRESVAEAGIFAPRILGLRGGGWDKSWKGMVQEAEADYDIMQSPLTTEEEIRCAVVQTCGSSLQHSSGTTLAHNLSSQAHGQN